MPKYLMLLRDDSSQFEALSPEEMQAIIGRYMEWSDRLQASGHLVASDKLTDGDGRVLVHQDGTTRTLDGPYSETKEVVGGFLMVQAADYEEAAGLCEGCPHLEFGSVEIRQVEDFGEEGA